MVVLGSDDGLIASGERTFISGSPRPCRCVLNAVLGQLESWYVPQIWERNHRLCERLVCLLQLR